MGLVWRGSRSRRGEKRWQAADILLEIFPSLTMRISRWGVRQEIAS